MTIEQILKSIKEVPQNLSMKVIDLFSGAGGFSEGFRQAGFDVVWAIDNWERACETHRKNHSETEVLEEDIMEVDIDDIPDVDVIIGSPPCKEFSYANNGGNGDIEKGMAFIYRFLEVVYKKNPEYWIMENVPRVADHLDDKVPLRKLGIDEDGTFKVPDKNVLNCANYGTPQRRKRLFSGDYPLPEENDQQTTLGDVINFFPSQTESRDEKKISDPNYDLELEEESLTDHFYNTHLTQREKAEIEKKKIDHSYYGSMIFPDDTSSPSRTVVALNRRVSRETIVLKDDSREGYSDLRMPSLRELASLQGFPIHYQFDGRGFSQKRRLIGNAVPPTLSFNLAKAIAKEEDMDVKRIIDRDIADVSVDMNDRDYSNRGNRKLSISRKFRHHVPYDDMREFRVDLENEKENQPKHPLSKNVEVEIEHPVRFFCKFYKGYASDVESTRYTFDDAEKILNQLRDHDESSEPKIRGFLEKLVKLGEDIPDATTFQAIRSRRKNPDNTIEYDLLERIGDIVDSSFPEEKFGDKNVHTHLLEGTKTPYRTATKIVACAYFADKLNRCGCWINRNPSKLYIPDDVSIDEDTIENLNHKCDECVDEEVRKPVAPTPKSSK